MDHLQEKAIMNKLSRINSNLNKIVWILAIPIITLMCILLGQFVIYLMEHGV